MSRGSDFQVRSYPARAVPEDAWRSLQALPEEAPREDMRALVAFRNGTSAARLAIGFAVDMARAPGRTGMIGWYEATDAEAGVLLLRQALDILGTMGPERIIGPIHGNTWSRYRLALPRTGKEEHTGPAFLGEPRNPAEYNDHFREAGLHPLWTYESRLVRRPSANPEREAESQARLRRFGVRVRPLDFARFEKDLRAVYDLSLEAFADNWFYTPIPFAPFAAAHERMRPILDPSLVLLAEGREGALLGYGYAYPDPNAPVGRSRIVLKTLAASRAARRMGIGRALVAAIHRVARERGVEVIHALTQSSNTSTSISAQHEVETFRRYALYGVQP